MEQTKISFGSNETTKIRQVNRSKDKRNNIELQIDREHIEHEMVNFHRWKHTFSNRKYRDGKYKGVKISCKKPTVERLVNSIFPDGYKINIVDIIKNESIVAYSCVLTDENNHKVDSFSDGPLKDIFIQLIKHYEDNRQYYFEKIYKSKFVDIQQLLNIHIERPTNQNKGVDIEKVREIKKRATDAILKVTTDHSDKILEIAKRAEFELNKEMGLIDDIDQIVKRTSP